MLGHLRIVALLLHTQRSSRHKNCRIGGLMFHNQHTWNSTPNSLLPMIQQTKYYICSSTYPPKNILLVTRGIIIASLAKFGNCCSMVWGCRQGQWKDFDISFSEEVVKSYVLFECIFGCAFLSPRTTKIYGIKNYPSTSMSCCSDDLAQLLPCLDLWSLWSENVSVRE